MRKRLVRFLGVVVIAGLTGAGFYTGMAADPISGGGFWFNWAMLIGLLVIWDEGER